MNQSPHQAGSVSSSNQIGNDCRAVVAVIETASEKVAARRAAGNTGGIAALTRIDNLIQDLESLLDVTKKVQEKTKSFSRATIPDSTRHNTRTILSACETTVTELDAAISAIPSGGPSKNDIEAMQASLRAYTSALSLALDVVNVSSEVNGLNPVPKTVSLQLKHQTDGVILSIIDVRKDHNATEAIMRLDRPARDRKSGPTNQASRVSQGAGRRSQVMILDIALSESDTDPVPELPNAVDANGRPFVSVNRPRKRANHEFRSSDMNRELTHARWTQVVVDGEAFGASDDYRLRPTLFAKPRPIQMLVSICLSDPEHLFSIFKNIPAAFDTLDRAANVDWESRGKGPFGDGRWKHRILHIHCPIYPRKNLAFHLHDLGVRPLMDKEEVREFGSFGLRQLNRRDAWSIYENTTQMRFERSREAGAAGTSSYSAYLEADSTPLQVIVTNGQEQLWTKGTFLEISVAALFQPTWTEIRDGLRTKLQPTTTVYADSQSVVQHLLGPDVLERIWRTRTNGGDMSDPVPVPSEPAKVTSRPSRKSFFFRRWSLNRSSPDA